MTKGTLDLAVNEKAVTINWRKNNFSVTVEVPMEAIQKLVSPTQERLTLAKLDEPTNDTAQ